MSVTTHHSGPKARHRAVAAAVTAVLLAGAAPAQAGPDKPRRGTVTITFSYRLDDAPDAAGPAGTQASCTLRLPRRANGIAVLRAAVTAGCIESFSTVTDDGRELLRCIDQLCAHVTKSRGVIPDTEWFVAWGGDSTKYGRSGLKAYAASHGDRFDCELLVVN